MHRMQSDYKNTDLLKRERFAKQRDVTAAGGARVCELWLLSCVSVLGHDQSRFHFPCQAESSGPIANMM